MESLIGFKEIKFADYNLRMKKLILSLGFIVLSSPTFATCKYEGPNVILLTWDGVRNYEVFHGTGPFHAKKLKWSERGRIFKNMRKNLKEAMLIGRNNYSISSDIAVSLPSYQALMAGKSTGCMNNSCDLIKEETVFDRIQKELKLEKKSVAAFASWEGLSRAVSSDPSKMNTFIYPDISVMDKDEELQKLQEKSMNDLPHWKGSRKDSYTWKMANHYLKTYCPRLLFVSLVDSDEYGHENNYPAYVKSLRDYDQQLDDLIKNVKEMGEYGENTTIIVTTDHSRGAGPLWVGHGHTKETEKDVFLFAWGRGVKDFGKQKHSGNHNMIKPTIEYLMGLTPTSSILPGISLD